MNEHFSRDCKASSGVAQDSPSLEGYTALGASTGNRIFRGLPQAEIGPPSLLRIGLIAIICTGLLLANKTARAAPGMDEKVDRTIMRALRLLAREQQSSGAWIIDNIGESTAATSLAVMAFLASGHVPGEGPYGERMERGIRWVIDSQQDNGLLDRESNHSSMYSHGISTLMLAEVVGMLREPLATDCQTALASAVRLILQAQQVAKTDRHAGGWRYSPTSRDSDLSITGWQLLALRAAKSVGCDVPAEAIDQAVQYVKSCSLADRRGFAYQPGNSPTATRTGTGILALEICGKHREPETLAGAEYLMRHPLKYRDHFFFYGAYYCSVGMFKVGGDYWTKTKRNLVPVLLRTQRSDGSWATSNHGSEHRAGIVYSTSLAVLALAVEYRYLPIYQR